MSPAADDIARELRDAVDLVIGVGGLRSEHPGTLAIHRARDIAADDLGRFASPNGMIERLCARARACCDACRAAERLLVAGRGREDMRLQRIGTAYEYLGDRPGVRERIGRVEQLLDEERQRGAAATAEQRGHQLAEARLAQQQEMLRWQTSATRETSFATLADARRAGWHDAHPDEYGGEQTWVRSRSGRVVRMLRRTERALSRTEWGRRGYHVLDEAVPHAEARGRVGGSSGKAMRWPVYRADQVRPRVASTRT
ncbi:hypothetical protein K2Z84_31970 [Candidatus Binatia bacterium]|nr:hypothetical protein [Candidatus Binatia bacterium]